MKGGDAELTHLPLDRWEARAGKLAGFIRKTFVVWFILCCLLAAFTSFYKLGVDDIVSFDEARHGVNAYEMLKSGDFLVSTYGYATDYYNLKPPLSFWCIALSYRLFGFNAFALRFYSALSYLILTIIAGLSVKKHHGPLAALLAMILLATCDIFLNTHMARTGDADSLFVLLYTLSMLGTIRFIETGRRLPLYGACAAFAFAFLAKSWHAGCIPVTMLLCLLLTKTMRRLKLRDYLICFSLACIPGLIWGFARYRADGMQFIQQMFLYDLVKRSANVIEGNEGSLFFYVLLCAGNRFLCFVLLVCGVGATASTLGSSRPSPRAICYLIWFLVPFVLFSFVQTKLQWYVFPALVPAILVAAATLGKLIAAIPSRSALQFGATVSLTVYLAVISVLTAYSVYIKTENTAGLQYFLRTCSRDAAYAGRICYEESAYWRQNNVLQAELSGDFRYKNGGRGAFHDDGEVGDLLIISKKAYDERPVPSTNILIESDTGYLLLEKAAD